MTLWVFTYFVCSARWNSIAVKDLTEQERARIYDKVNACYELAEQYLGRQFPRPQITFRKSGKTAGTAFLNVNRINFHPLIYKSNQDSFINDVVPHEVSHLLVWQCFGKVKPHGREWQSMMSQVFACAPEVTHKFDTAELNRNTFDYQCACGVVELGVRRHNKVLKGAQYRCKRCGNTLQQVKVSETNAA